MCASKPWSFSSACKNLSWQRPLVAEIWSSEKVELGGSKLTSPTLLLVDQSSPDFFRQRERNCYRSISFRILDISILSGDIRDRSLNLFQVDHNFARFWPHIFWGRAPKFWDLNYIIDHSSHHVAKFHVAPPPRELREKRKKRNKRNICSKTQTFPVY